MRTCGICTENMWHLKLMFSDTGNHANMGGSGGVVNSLDFGWHCLSPLAAFTSGVYFLHNGRW